MELTFYDIFRFITVFQFFYLALILITLRRGNRVSNRIFAVFLFSKAFCFSNSLVARYAIPISKWSPHVFYIGESFEFLLGPALLLYTQSLAYRDFKMKKSHALHLIPFVIHIAFLSYKFHFYSAETKMQLLRRGVFSPAEGIINSMAIYLQFLIYSAAVLWVLYNYRKELKQNYSFIDKIKLSWLGVMVGGFIVLWGTGFIHFFYRLAGNRSIYPYSISIVMLFIFANIILYKGMKHPEIFNGIERPQSQSKPIIPDTSYHQYVNDLKKHMDKEKPYLIPTISLADLAERISISPRYLSYVINKSSNQNFFTFINAYRVKESQDLLSDPENKSKTVLDILYDVGFNNKSVFNAAFKKHTGMTPTQFRKQRQI